MSSLRNKRFHLVSEQRKTEEGDFVYLRHFSRALSLYTDVVLFFAFFLLYIGVRESEANALVINKSPAVYFLSLALDGL